MASKLSTYDFSTLYTTLPHHLIKDKLIALIEHTFTREKTLYLACNEERAFFTSDVYNNYKLRPVKTFVKPLFIYRICFYFVMKEISWFLSRENQIDIIEAFNSTSIYLDDLLNIDNIYFEHMVTGYTQLNFC